MSTPYPGVIVEPQGVSTSVAITDSAGHTPTVYADRFGLSTISMPDTITARKTYFLPGEGPWTITPTANGEMTSASTVTLEGDEVATVTVGSSFTAGQWAQLGAYDPLPMHSTTPEAHGAKGNDSTFDDAPGIEAAIAAVVAACIADGSYSCEVVFDDTKLYYANRAAVKNPTLNGAASYAYGQISLPYMAYNNGANPKVTLTLRTRHRLSSIYNFENVPCGIVSTVTSSPGFDNTYGQPSILSGAQYWQLPANPRVVQYGNALDLVIDGVNFLTPGAPHLAAVYGQMLQGLRFTTCTISQQTTSYGGIVTATDPTATAVTFPASASDGTSHYDYLAIAGYWTGVVGGEHHDGGHLWLWSNNVAFDPFDPPNATGGGGTIQHLHMADNKYGFAHTSPDTTTVFQLGSYVRPLKIGLWVIEYNSVTPIYHVYDTNNVGNIDATFQQDPASTPAFNVNGGAHCKFQDILYPRGNLATPKVPAASTAQQVTDSNGNVVWRDCMIAVTGGTGVTVSIDGTSTGLTSGTFLVPSGKTFNLGAYTAAPTLVVTVS